MSEIKIHSRLAVDELYNEIAAVVGFKKLKGSDILKRLSHGVKAKRLTGCSFVGGIYEVAISRGSEIFARGIKIRIDEIIGQHRMVEVKAPMQKSFDLELIHLNTDYTHACKRI